MNNQQQINDWKTTVKELNKKIKQAKREAFKSALKQKSVVYGISGFASALTCFLGGISLLFIGAFGDKCGQIAEDYKSSAEYTKYIQTLQLSYDKMLEDGIISQEVYDNLAEKFDESGFVEDVMAETSPETYEKYSAEQTRSTVLAVGGIVTALASIPISLIPRNKSADYVQTQVAIKS